MADIGRKHAAGRCWDDGMLPFPRFRVILKEYFSFVFKIWLFPSRC